MAGLLLAPLFAVALLLAIATTFTLVKDAIDSRGDASSFESRIRHYSDRLEVGPDGSLVSHRASHPIAMFVAMTVASWVVVLILGSILERLRRDVWARHE